MDRPKEIKVFSFGRVIVPMQVNEEDECLETVLNFGAKDVSNFLQSMWHYYFLKSDQTNRQQEIAELINKLLKLIKKEKRVGGTLWSPILLKGETSD